MEQEKLLKYVARRNDYHKLSVQETNKKGLTKFDHKRKFENAIESEPRGKIHDCKRKILQFS